MLSYASHVKGAQKHFCIVLVQDTKSQVLEAVQLCNLLKHLVNQRALESTFISCVGAYETLEGDRFVCGGPVLQLLERIDNSPSQRAVASIVY